MIRWKISMDLNKRIVSINKISEAGPANAFWPVVFTAGCNLRCPYCLNSYIVESPKKLLTMSMEQVLAKLDEWGEEGVMISGGEPCLPNEDCTISDLVKALAVNGRKVGISTNGSYPDILKSLLDENLLSFVALDCKFGPTCKFTNEKKAVMIGACLGMHDDMYESLMVVHNWHNQCPEAQSEIRMTMYPPLVEEADVVQVGKFIHPKSRLILQQYRENQAFRDKPAVKPYPEEEIERIKTLIGSSDKFPVEIRWP
jgi:pyruvate formate lyase activating enzyme